MCSCRLTGMGVKIKFVLQALALMIACLKLNAQTEKYIQTLTGSIRKGDSCVVTDDKFHDAQKWATIEKHTAVDNLVTFELRYDTVANYFDRNFSCTLQVDIELEKADNTKQQLKNITLVLNFDTARGSTHQGVAWYRCKDAHRVKIVVNKITSPQWGNKLPPVFRIKNEIFIERLYTLNTKEPAQKVISFNTAEVRPPLKQVHGVNHEDNRTGITDGQQTITWDANDPAFPQYDLEWTFYDDSSQIGKQVTAGAFDFSTEGLAAVFKNNSSRVTINLPAYNVNLVYNPGWVFHRVRGVRYDQVTGERTEGAWSYAGSYTYNNSLYGLIRVTGHEAYLNWQYNRTCAEDGKRKEVVKYFDGSLRDRQSVALNNDNTGSRTLVQENIYDAAGRSAVNLLPAPTEEEGIHYFRSFNRSAASEKVYDYTDFEDTLACQRPPSTMSAASGTSRYYSPLNPLKDDHSNAFYFTKYIPDAKGYPFSVTRYTPDNTSRIRIQGGIGELFQPGKTAIADDHTTRYYYGKPQQEELDRLFGNEAGNASHYLKNMVIDANGQTTVTYINAGGKTIATALAGENPANLERLASCTLKSTPFITSLADRDNIVRDAANLSLTYRGTFLAGATGTFILKYAFTPVSLQVLYGIQNEKICADCFYDLLIRVTDNCGNIVESVNQEAIFTEKITCDPAPTEQEGELPVTIQQTGEYNITYQLKLSQKAIDYYAKQYLLQNISLNKEIDFARNYLHRLNLKNCFNNCETCLADLGTTENFIARVSTVLQQQDSIIPNADDSTWMKSLYKQLLEECTLLQEGCGKTALPCEEQTLQLKEDVSLGGQYMLFDNFTSTFTDRDINVFLKNRTFLTMPVTINGVTKPLNTFSETEIIDNWRNEWSDLLLPWHPENLQNCFIADCSQNAVAEQYDKLFLNTNTEALAAARQLWFLDDYRAVVNNDPYFKAGEEGASKKMDFINALTNYKGFGIDIMAFVRWNIYCSYPVGDSNYPQKIISCPRNRACNRQQDEWQLFKVLYYSAKQDFKKIKAACTSVDLFKDPLQILSPEADQPLRVPVACAAASLFLINNTSSQTSIQYTGNLKTEQDVAVGYFAVDNNHEVIENAGGTIIFPAGAESGSLITIPAVDGFSYVINFARCDGSHPYYTKTRRNYNGMNVGSLTSQLQNQTQQGLNTIADASIKKECSEACDLNADGWMQKLDGCNLAIGSAEYNQIREGLLAICKNSCLFHHADHPFGASSTESPTVNGDKNFKDVLLRVLGSARFSTICNELLLDYPAPADAKPLYANEVVRTLSSCAYDKLQSWKLAYSTGAGYTGFAQYIQKEMDPAFSLNDAQIENLLTAYENNCLLPLPLLLPASLSCNNVQPHTCLTCSELKDEQANFAVAYNYVAAGDPDYYFLLAKYINQKYTFNLSSTDVFEAGRQCNLDTAHTGDTITCEAFKTAYNNFELLKPDYFTNPNGNHHADSLYEFHLVTWLNTALQHHLDLAYYKKLAVACAVSLDYPGNNPSSNCDTSTQANCAPQFITCCERFTAMDKFIQIFPDSVSARLLALYFSLQRTQWCTPVNLPNVDYNLPYDSIVLYFNQFRLAGGYTITLRPDGLISYTSTDSAGCNSMAFNFVGETHGAPQSRLYAICNKPLQPELATDDNSCISEQVNVALSNAHSDYLEYMEKIKRDYRDAYYSKCLNILPRLTLEAVYNQPLEYHYTLYYYDQAGNLVKTIPPSGVRPLDDVAGNDDKMQRVKNFRLADKENCYEYGDAPALNENAFIKVPGNVLVQQDSLPFTLEAFVRLSNIGNDQTFFTKTAVNVADNKTDGYKVYTSNGRLMVDIAAHGEEMWVQTLSKIVQYPWPAPYASQPPVNIRSKIEVPVPRKVYRSLTVELTSSLSDLIRSNQWVHIAIQYTGSRNTPVNIYIDGSIASTHLLTNEYAYTPAAPPLLPAAEITAGTTELDFRYVSTIRSLSVSNVAAADFVIGSAQGGLNGSVKQIRLYNRLLPPAELRSNAFNTCLTPQNEGALVLWLPLNKEDRVGSSTDRINQLVTTNTGTVFSNAYQPVYPSHSLPTHYYYNSLNAITNQVTPDAGTTRFFYDLLGRLVVSQNAEQETSTTGEAGNRYSYTRYDALGRIIEMGEKTGAAAMTAGIAKSDPAANISLDDWLASAVNTQITQNIYDRPNSSIVTNTAITGVQNIYNTSRKRIVASIYRNTMTTPADYNSAIHYQYDITGNIKHLWQEHKKSATGTVVNLLKDLQYDYDLISGKVNHIIYQKEKGDQFVYKYEYDADNRLLRAFSGRDLNILQQDASYRYYLHGPLARMELGDALTNRIVQGCDYTYTLQGWLKAVNGSQMPLTGDAPGSTDAGGDGSPLAQAGIHAQIGADALTYTLGYYQDDYTAIGGSAVNAFRSDYRHPATNEVDASGKALFNGNISNAVFSIAGIDNNHARGYTYGYDQLNRIIQMRAHNLSATAPATGWSNSSIREDHKESFGYDANGNLLKLYRNGMVGAGRTLPMDDLDYFYYYYTLNRERKSYAPGQNLPADAWALTNQLAHIKDAVPSANYPNAAYPDEKDIDDQPANNYSYDGNGNLVADNTEGISKIAWTAYGKIRRIDKSKSSIIYDYDAAGNRIQKQVISNGSKTITNYIRDVQGNIFAVYNWKAGENILPAPAVIVGNGVTGQTWDEQHLYGSNRLGIWLPGITVPATLNTTTGGIAVGSKLFELTNHLGNVLAVISDRKVSVATDNPALTDHYVADLISSNDYTPFGMQMVGRHFQLSSSAYRYGFNGKENDDEVKGAGSQQDYGMRIYDPRVGRFLSVDPATASYPMLSPYQFSSNNPVAGVDQDGLEYSQAGKVGIFAIDQTAVQLYPDNPRVIIQQKADAPMVHLNHEIARIHSQPAYLSVQRGPANEFERERHEINKRAWYDRDGYNADGSPKPATRLAQNKTWNAFASNLALPLINAASYVEGEGEINGLLKVAGSFLEKKEFEALAKTGSINPKLIRFSQDNIAANFKDGQSVNALINALEIRGTINIEPIRLVEKDGLVFTLDNRRLYAFQIANLEIPYIKLDKIPFKEFKKFSTINNGVSIEVRKGKPIK